MTMSFPDPHTCQKDDDPKALEDLIQLLLINNEMEMSRRLHRSQSDETRAS